MTPDFWIASLASAHKAQALPAALTGLERAARFNLTRLARSWRTFTSAWPAS
jgi:hypothetical protein